MGSAELVMEMAYALGLGLFVGLEREHHELSEDISPMETPEQRGVDSQLVSPLGMRSFGLLGLLGWVIAVAGAHWSWLVPAGVVAVGALVLAQYLTIRDAGPGITTEIAALLTFVLGMVVRIDRPLAVTLALATVLLLASKPSMRSLLVKLRRVEITATIQLLILVAIVLPLLPEEPLDPWQALPPRKVGMFVVLIAGVGYLGYLSSRLLGERRGAGLTGILGGITSSTAVTVAMSRTGRVSETMQLPGQLAVFLANAVMCLRVVIIAAFFSASVAATLMAPVGVMGLVMLGGALWKWLRMRATPDAGLEEQPRLTNPFALVPALVWGAILCVVILVSVIARELFGDSGVLVAAAASGLADVDAITLAVTRQAGTAIDTQVATLAVAIAVVSNTVVKGGIALVAGGRKFGRDVALVFAAAIGAGLLAAAVVVGSHFVR